MGQGFARASSLLSGSTPAPARVAILNSYDSRWSIQWQRHHRDFDYVAHLLHYYRPLAARNIAVDVVSADAPLDGYKLVIAPALLILNEDRAERLKKLVSRGRHLVLTVRCAMKDDYNRIEVAINQGSFSEKYGFRIRDKVIVGKA